MQKMQVIGICGVQHGAGVTHLAVAMANYFRTVLNHKTVVVDYSKNQELYLSVRMQKDKKAGICCLSGQEMQGFITVPHCDTLVLDLGCDFKNAGRLFPFCDRKIMLASMAFWKKQELIRFLDVLGQDGCQMGQLMFLCRNEVKKDAIALEREYGIALYPVPSIQDPSRMEPQTIGFLQRL